MCKKQIGQPVSSHYSRAASYEKKFVFHRSGVVAVRQRLGDCSILLLLHPIDPADAPVASFGRRSRLQPQPYSESGERGRGIR